MQDAPEVTEGSGNVFADLGLEDADDLLVKADLAGRISDVLEERALTQAQAAEILGVTQPRVSDLLRGRLDLFSIEALIRFLNALDRDVELVVRPKPEHEPRARLRVAAS